MTGQGSRWEKEIHQDDPELKRSATVNAVKAEEIDYYWVLNKLKRSVAWIMKLKKVLWSLKEERQQSSKIIHNKEKDPEKQRVKLQVHMKKFK